MSSVEQHMPELPLIDRMKIVAELLVPLVQEMEAQLGRERAHAIVRAGVSRRFREVARQAFAVTGDAMGALMAVNSGVRLGEDLEADMRESPDGFEMDVTSCVYARFFQQLGAPELGFVLMCSSDFDTVEELPGVELSRSQTIMQGAGSCDFRYRFGS